MTANMLTDEQHELIKRLVESDTLQKVLTGHTLSATFTERVEHLERGIAALIALNSMLFGATIFIIAPLYESPVKWLLFACGGAFVIGAMVIARRVDSRDKKKEAH